MNSPKYVADYPVLSRSQESSATEKLEHSKSSALVQDKAKVCSLYLAYVVYV